MKTWFKFYGAEYLADPKMDRLSAVEKALWTTMLCLASVSDEEGIVKYVDEDYIMQKTNLNDNEKLSNRNFLTKFQKLKMITVDNENGEIVITLSHFEKRQAPLSNYERVKGYRERKKLEDQPQMITNDNDKNRIEEKEQKDKIRINDPQKFSDRSLPKGFYKLGEQARAIKATLTLLIAFFILSIPVSAHEVRVRYTISTPAGRSSGSQATSPKTQSERPSAGRVQVNKSLPVTKPTPRTLSLAPVVTVDKSYIPSGYVEELICKYFKNDCRTAVAVARAESGLRCDAIGDGHLDPKSYGVFQIRGFSTRPSPEALMDCETNISWAYGMFKAQGWQPWSAFTNGSYLRFL